MKKAITALLPCIVFSSLSAIENDTFSFTKEHRFEDQFYHDLTIQVDEKTSLKKYAAFNLAGIPFLVAEFKVGLRKEDSSLGYDCGLTGHKGRKSTSFGGYGSLLYLLNPEDKAKYYIGCGVEVAPYWNTKIHGVLSSPLFSMGRSRLSNSGLNDFFQLNVNWPIIGYFHYNVNNSISGSFSSKKPYVSLDYGLFF